MQQVSSAAFTDTKPHYELLDGLRGIAALLVLWYHVQEGFAFAEGAPVIEHMNHGYLAVDFFFILSGFVIGYAYDDRWNKSLTMGNFFKRRLIRLHPMVVLGAVVGAVCFLLQGSVQWDGTHVAISSVMIALLLLCFYPCLTGRNGRSAREWRSVSAQWSGVVAFYEYIGNILYALMLRRLSTKSLTALVIALGGGLMAFTWLDMSGYGSFGVGWTMQGAGFWSGLLRMMFPFAMGLLLSRHFRPVKIRGAFWICSAVLLLLFLVPPIASSGTICMNGVFESFCIIVMFPLLVWLGASGKPPTPCLRVSVSSWVIFRFRFILPTIPSCTCFMRG